MSETLNVEKLFGENVFTLGKMQERIPLRLRNRAEAAALLPKGVRAAPITERVSRMLPAALKQQGRRGQEAIS